jgi:uncharacterized protein (DUF305 family)
VEAGFLRDMSVHHSQAVTLGMLALERTVEPAVRELAEETVMAQQREIGVMTGWLEQWGLAASTTRPAMSWMSHRPAAVPPADPPMPGMATRRDVARLAVARGRGADVLFCELLIPHHLGGVHMLDEVIRRSGRPEVTELAVRMRATQQREITELNRLVADLTRGRRGPGTGPARAASP